jgi:outer membrane protein
MNKSNSMFCRFIILTGFLVFAIHPVKSQDTIRQFSLREAQDYALENNYSHLNANLDIESARKEVWATTAIGLPQVSGTVNYQHVPGEIPTFNIGAGFMPIINRLNEIHPGQFDDIMQGLSQSESAIAVKNSTTYSLTVNQLVFSGEYIVGLQASRTFLQLSQNAKEKSEDEMKANVASGYYTALVLEENKNILDSTLVNLEKLLKETKAFVETGFLEETDFDQLQVTYNTVENSLNAIDRQIEVSYLLFKIQLGMGLEEKVVLTESIQDFLLQMNPDQLISEEFNLQENIDYRMLETQEQIQALSLKREKSKFLPSVNAFYTYTDRTNRPDFDFTINHVIGLGVNVPIFSSGQKLARVQQAQIELEKAKNNKAQTADNLIMGVDQARNQFQNAFEKYKTQQKNVALTKKIYDRTLIKYKEGMASSLDLTQANNQYLDSNSAYTNAILELLNAKITLDKTLNNF